MLLGLAWQGTACGAIPPARGSWWHSVLRKGMPSALPRQGIVPRPAAPALKNARFLSCFGPACSGTQHCPRGQDVWGPRWGFLICGSALFPECHMKSRDLVLGPGASPGAWGGRGWGTGLSRPPCQRPSIPGPGSGDRPGPERPRLPPQ